MRIVAGDFRGRPIAAPKTNGTRPTSDRARETVFNILSHAEWAPPLAGARVIDLFAGSGALGLEAISRGADFALFIEMGLAARAALLENISVYGISEKAQFQRRDIMRLGAMSDDIEGPFDIAFIDPPYFKQLVPRSLAGLKAGGWLKAEALCVVETGADEAPELSGWTVRDTRKSGAAKFWFLSQA